jgi:hypothetical protein
MKHKEWVQSQNEIKEFAMNTQERRITNTWAYIVWLYSDNRIDESQNTTKQENMFVICSSIVRSRFEFDLPTPI